MNFEAREEWVQLCSTWETDKENYDWVYPKILHPFRDKKLKILEIGVHYGSSLLLFDDYFYNAEIYGLDIDSTKWKAGKFKEDIEKRPNIKIIEGSQSDVEVLFNLCNNHGSFDIIIDDGSHLIEDIICSFEMLKNNFSGLYIIEDTALTLTGKYCEIINNKKLPFIKKLCKDNNSALFQDRNVYENYWSDKIRDLDKGQSKFSSITFLPNIMYIESQQNG